MEKLNIVFVGDGFTGKSSLILNYSTNSFTSQNKEHGGINFHDFETIFEGKNISFCLVDTQGQEDYDRLRPLAYHNAHAFVLCYSIRDRNSFLSITRKWIPEIQSSPEWPVPLILVGTMKDLRDDATKKFELINTIEGESLALQISARKFIECSSKDSSNIRDVIDESLRAATNGITVEEKIKRSSCFSCNLI